MRFWPAGVDLTSEARGWDGTAQVELWSGNRKTRGSRQSSGSLWASRGPSWSGTSKLVKQKRLDGQIDVDYQNCPELALALPRCETDSRVRQSYRPDRPK